MYGKLGMQNPFCHFFMDEPQGSYSPVHGDSCSIIEIKAILHFSKIEAMSIIETNLTILTIYLI